ncbi:AraC family transcriptional regulator [Paenibacillus protaetiae]|uniref:AraC family transcriptional regulator n=1 Tax=Paenibacillus protaetiae TaxID=2509456 RepID=A0A4P6EUZ6_9BACL|nr:AraC family transcriptional regulator [Paenibacillus protaetiae]QAY66506.1 AraC family transcriptional regulator [Paenibacillus protaetiae]
MSRYIHPELTYFVQKECTPSWKLDTHRISFYDIVFVLEGQADYTINGKEYHVQQGDVLYIKAQSVRSAVTTGMVCAALDFVLDDGNTIDLPVVTSGLDLEQYQWLLQELNYEWLQQKDGYEMKCHALLSLIIHKLIYEGKAVGINSHVDRMKRYIVEHYDEPLTVGQIARASKLNAVYGGALFKRVEGRSISEFLNRVRINKAASLLETGEYNVGEVADRTGFKDIYYFSNTFKRLMGVSPASYKNNYALHRRL